MLRPDFDSIINYEQFKKYTWSREELRNICQERGLLFVGSAKKLSKVIEAYFNGEIIPPRRNWYTNRVLLSYVNDNGLLMGFDIALLVINLIITVIGIINKVNGADSLYYVPFLVFGIIGLIVAVLFAYWGQDLNVIMSYFPICGDKRFTRAQVDEQANSVETECLGYEDILLAPDMLIGVTSGVAAIAYEDIASLQVRQTWHNERIGPRGSTKYREYYTYKIIVKTNKGKKIAVSYSKREAESTARSLYEQCQKHNPRVVLLDMQKSSMAPDNSKNQITEGKGVRYSVDRAVDEQFLMNVSIGEDLRKRFIRFHLRLALILIPESLLAAAIAGVIVYVAVAIIGNIRGVFIILPLLLFPFYAAYNLITALIAIRKDDIEFYYGEIVNKNEKGYFIKGVDAYRFNYIMKLRSGIEPGVGDRVILARFRNEFSLISEQTEDKMMNSMR
ncbi:MAG: SAP domain-containing protein [Saccharofermentans sp.]|nr:SAP domain-containing protein [Saccharofermentans sp.]